MIIPLAGLHVLEVGCGNGKRTVELAKRCASVVGIDPDNVKLEQATARRIPNAEFQVGVGEHLDFPDHTFNAVFFTSSFHHIPIDKMSIGLAEAMRVLRPSGYIVFLEPGEGGSFIEAEEQFEIGDGDERPLIAAAYRTIKTAIGAHVLHDLDDETIFKFESAQDFITSMEPKKNQSQIKDFLGKNNYQMNLDRRIIIAQPE